MTDNEIKREQPSFEVRAESLKKRTKEFFSTYENPSGSEDRLEICLIRDGCRAVSQAEEIINRQKAEKETMQLFIDFLRAEIERLNSIRLIYDGGILTKISDELYKKIKAEAVEYALEWLQKNQYINHSPERRKQLVKEIVGEG